MEATTSPTANSTIGYASITFPIAGFDFGVAWLFCFGNTTIARVILPFHEAISSVSGVFGILGWSPFHARTWSEAYGGTSDGDVSVNAGISSPAARKTASGDAGSFSSSPDS